jgi:Fe-S-cluster containining protein
MNLPVIKTENVGRCTGHCCKKFPLPFPNLKSMFTPEYDSHKYQNGEQIRNMVIFLEPHPTKPEYGYYTCKNLTTNGDCAIYDQRPRMCSEYPYGDKCVIPGCTMVNQK